MRAAGFKGLFTKGGKLRPFRLLAQDVRNLPKRYIGDWTTFDQLVFASAVYVFFTNLLPGITFASDLYSQTGANWGTIEVVFSTGLCGVIFSLFSIQPLVILGVTGPFAVLAENIYRLCTNSFNVPFLPFMAWSLLHATWMHALLAIFNAHDYTMRYVTTFSAEIFSLLNSIIYFHKAIQELERAHANLPFDAFLYAIIGACGTFFLALFLSTAESWKPLFHRYVRLGLREYAAAISIIFFIGIPYAGDMRNVQKGTLAVSNNFSPSDPQRTTFLVPFWTLPVGWVFAAILPGAIITVLFFFDHEISSIICTGGRYKIRKPTGFAIDILLLGLTTGLCGILGLPPANGLLPQAPLHSESLLHDTHEPTKVIRADGSTDEELREVTLVKEQRWSHFLHAAAIFAFVSPPLQHVLGLTPTSVLAGLFLFMGEQSLAVNPILARVGHLLTPVSELPELPKALRLASSSSSTSSTSDVDTAGQTNRGSGARRSWKTRGASLFSDYGPIHAYTLTQILLTAGIFAMTLTVAGPAFPIVIIALVPIRLTWMRKMWNRETLRYVDAWACREGTPEGDEDDAVADEAMEKAGGHLREQTTATATSADLEGGSAQKDGAATVTSAGISHDRGHVKHGTDGDMGKRD